MLTVDLKRSPKLYTTNGDPAMPAPHWSTKLEPFRPCAEALDYARSKPSFAAAWRDCERGDWMLWILGKLSGPPDSASRKAFVAATVDCAALARKYTSGEIRKAFDACQRTARKYLRGAATLAEVRTAADASYAAADAASYAASSSSPYAYASSYAYAASYAAAYASYAAASAADAADDASYAASYAADAAYAADDASYAAYAADDAASAADCWARALSRCASIVRRHYPNPPRLRKGA